MGVSAFFVVSFFTVILSSVTEEENAEFSVGFSEFMVVMSSLLVLSSLLDVTFTTSLAPRFVVPGNPPGNTIPSRLSKSTSLAYQPKLFSVYE